MAQPAKIIPKKSVVSKVPDAAALVAGEIAVNYADKKIYGKHPQTGVVVELGGADGGTPGPHRHDEISSLDDTQILEITNAGQLAFQNGATAAVKNYNLPATGGTLGLRGGDTVFSDAEPSNPYPGLRWVNTATGRVYDRYVWRDAVNTERSGWVEFSGGGGSAAAGSASVVWGDIQNKPTSFTPESHSHAANEVTGLALLAKTGSYGDLLNTPTTFTPKAHAHVIGDITNLQTTLNGLVTTTSLTAALATKQAAGAYANSNHTHDASAITSGTISVDRLPVLPSSAPPIVLSGLISGITLSEEGNISQGTIVISSDGKRYIYKGTGSKTSTASYIELSDISPQWGSIAGVPSTFTPATHNHPVSEITGFESAVAGYVAAYAPTITVADNAGLENVSGQLTTRYNTTIGDTVESIKVGGANAKAASEWKTKTVVEVLDEILFPTIAPSIKTAKSASISGVDEATLEVGASYSRALTAGFNQGLIKNGDGSDGPALVGAVAATSGYTFSGTGIVSAAAQNGNTYSLSSVIVAGDNKWSVAITHSAGSGAYYDNKGVASSALDSSRGAGSASETTPTVTGVYPYYYLRSASALTADQFVTAIQNGTATAVVAASSGALTIPYALNQQYIYVAYPTSSSPRTTYETSISDNGAITLVFEAVVQKTVTKMQGTTTIWSRQYHVHVGKRVTTSSNANIILR